MTDEGAMTTVPILRRPVGRDDLGAPPVPLRKGYFLNGQKVTKEPLKGGKAYAAQRSGLMAFPP